MSEIDRIKNDLALYLNTSKSTLIRFDMGDIQYLLSVIDECREALESSAMPKNQIHTMHPKCYCYQCKQRELLDKFWPDSGDV